MTPQQDLPQNLRQNLISALIPEAGEPPDPVRSAQKHLRRPLPKRFYTLASVGESAGGFALLLDGRPARTPAGTPFLVPTRATAQLAAGEWQAAGTHIDPAGMPVTRIINVGLCGVAREIAAVQAEVVKFAASDLVCYRAGEPASLVAAQSAAWDPVIAFAREALGARLVLAQGVVFAAQPAPALAAITRAVSAFATPLPLACLHVMTTLSGSALLALGLAQGRFDPAAAWAAAHVDEDFQIRAWGTDEEALSRRALRWQDFAAAATLLRSLTL